MEYESISFLQLFCVAFFMMCTVAFFYYLYGAIKGYLNCRSERNEDLPCPNTCNDGYECKQSEAAADFVIGEVVQEGVSEDDKQAMEAEAEAESVEATEGLVEADEDAEAEAEAEDDNAEADTSDIPMVASTI